MRPVQPDVRYLGDLREPEAAARILAKEGLVLLPLAADVSLQEDEETFDRVVFSRTVECIASDPSKRRSFDPSGKLSGSVNHHLYIRRWRMRMFDATREVLAGLARCKDLEGLKLSRPILERPAVACCPDAVLARPPADKVASSGQRVAIPEDQSGQGARVSNWHRDFSVGQEEGDLLVGGWRNWNAAQHQHFACVPHSHVDSDGHLISPAAAAYAKGFHSQLTEADLKAASEAAEIVRIPPGYLLIFVETMLHGICDVPRDVPPGSKPVTMKRIFNGARLSSVGGAEMYHPELPITLQILGPMPIKAGSYLPCLPRYGSFKNSAATMERAHAWIASNVRPELRETVRSKLTKKLPEAIQREQAWIWGVVRSELRQALGDELKFAKVLDAAWPAMKLYPYDSKEFPEYTLEEAGMFQLQAI